MVDLCIFFATVTLVFQTSYFLTDNILRNYYIDSDSKRGLQMLYKYLNPVLDSQILPIL